jgi:hypothetical protein
MVGSGGYGGLYLLHLKVEMVTERKAMSLLIFYALNVTLAYFRREKRDINDG